MGAAVDTSDSLEEFDFTLGEPGSVADNRAEQATEAASGDIELSSLFKDTLHRIMQSVRESTIAAAGCVIRVDGLAGLAGGALEAAQAQVRAQIARGLRAADACSATRPGEFCVLLGGCDLETARKRVALMLRLVELPDGGETRAWAGVAPIRHSGEEALRSARIACDLASFQDSGYVEVIDL